MGDGMRHGFQQYAHRDAPAKLNDKCALCKALVARIVGVECAWEPISRHQIAFGGLKAFAMVMRWRAPDVYDVG